MQRRSTLTLVAGAALATLTAAPAHAAYSGPTVTTISLHRTGANAGDNDGAEFVDDAGHVGGETWTPCVRLVPLPIVSRCDNAAHWAPGATQPQSLTPIGILSSSPVGQNASGTIVGTTYSGGAATGAVWKAGSTARTILPSGLYPGAIDDAGDVAGVAYDSASAGYVLELWHPTGTVTKLGVLGASTAVLGLDPTGHYVVLNDEVVVNGSYTSSGVVFHDGHRIDLGPSASVVAVNRTGTVVGSYAGHVATWTVGAGDAVTRHDWGLLRAGESASGTLIDDTGRIAGFEDVGGGGTRAFVGSGGTLTDVGTLGGTMVWPEAINAKGQLVGTASLAGDTRSHAFFWSQGHLTDLTPSTSVTQSTARDVNDSGLAVGDLYDATGPEKATAWQITGG